MSASTRTRGFTLIEVVVSLAITAVIAVFVFSFASSLARLWRSSEGSVSTELDAQIALDTIAMDLESAVFQERFDGDGLPVPMLAIQAISKSGEEAINYTFSTRWEGVSVTARPAEDHFDPTQHKYGWAGVWLRFFTSSPSFNAVGYQLIRRTPFSEGASEPYYLLHRSLIRQDRTLKGGFDITGPFAFGNTSEALAKPRLEAVFLEDVVDFGVRLFVYDDSAVATNHSPKGLRLIYPADTSGNLSSTDYEHMGSHFDSGAENRSTQYPDVVEIYLRVLDDVGSEQLARLEAGDTSLTYQEIIENRTRVFSRTVRLPGRDT